MKDATKIMGALTKNGGPAHPTVIPVGNGHAWSTGMTLRDWFAGQALAGLVTLDADCGPKGYASDAYQMADAMLAARQSDAEGEG